MRVICPNCNAVLEDNSKFCNNCGTRIENATKTEFDTMPLYENSSKYDDLSKETYHQPTKKEKPMQSANSPVAKPKEKKKKKTGLILGIIAAVVGIPVVILVALILVLVFGGDKETPPEQPTDVQMSEVELSDDIFDFDVSLDGVVYKMPATINEFESNGWTISDDAKSEMVAPGEDFEVSAKSDSGYITLIMYNDGATEKSVANCIVGGLLLSFNRSNTYTVKLSKGLVVDGDSTLDEVVSAWGKYDYVEKFDYFYEETRTYFHTCAYNFTTTKDGDLTSVGIKNYNADDVLEPIVAEDIIADMASPTDAMSDDLADGIISFEGKAVALPCKASEIVSAEGWQLTMGSTKLAPNETTTVYLTKDVRTHGFNDSVFIQILNTTDKEISIEDAIVIDIDYSDYNNMNALEFANGIKLGMSESDFLNASNYFHFDVEDEGDRTNYRSTSDEGGFEYKFVFNEENKLETMAITYNYAIDFNF